MTEETKFSDIKCPKCGCSPEIRIRTRERSMGNAEVRCAYNCLHYGTAFHGSRKDAVRVELERAWIKLVAEYADKQAQNKAD